MIKTENTNKSGMNQEGARKFLESEKWIGKGEELVTILLTSQMQQKRK